MAVFTLNFAEVCNQLCDAVELQDEDYNAQFPLGVSDIVDEVLKEIKAANEGKSGLDCIQISKSSYKKLCKRISRILKGGLTFDTLNNSLTRVKTSRTVTYENQGPRFHFQLKGENETFCLRISGVLFEETNRFSITSSTISSVTTELSVKEKDDSWKTTSPCLKKMCTTTVTTELGACDKDSTAKNYSGKTNSLALNKSCTNVQPSSNVSVGYPCSSANSIKQRCQDEEKVIHTEGFCLDVLQEKSCLGLNGIIESTQNFKTFLAPRTRETLQDLETNAREYISNLERNIREISLVVARLQDCLRHFDFGFDPTTGELRLNCQMCPIHCLGAYSKKSFTRAGRPRKNKQQETSSLCSVKKPLKRKRATKTQLHHAFE